MQETKPESLCDRLVEAGWLFCAAVLPLLVNPFADKPFEPAKAFLLRWVVAGMALAWAAGQLRGPRRTGQRPAPGLFLGASLVVLAAAEALSAACSILPWRSFLGSDSRVQGFVTLAAWLALFALATRGLRTRQQVARLLLAVSAASLPVSLYAVVQACGADPFRWAESFGGRVFSTIGNPIPAGAYLALSLFATVAAWFLLAPPAEGTGNRRRGLPTLLAVALVVQLAGLALSGSRGPWLGLAAGAALVFFFRSISRGRAALAGVLAGLFAAAAAFGAAALTPDRAVAAGSVPNARAAARTSGVRLLLWQGAARVFFSPTPLWSPAGADSRLSWRPWVGYGAETFPETYAQHASPELNRLEIPDVMPDRAHNEMWDLLCGNGVIGLSAYLLFLAAVLAQGLKALRGGLSPIKAGLAGVLPLLGGWCGGLACRWGGEPEWIGPGVFAGFLAGFLVAGLFLLAGREKGPSKGAVASSWLVPVLLGGLVCHLAEIQVAPPVVATRLLFLLLAAVLCSWRQWGWAECAAEGVVPGAGLAESRRGGRRKGLPSARERAGFSLEPGGILAGLAGAAFLFPFLVPRSGGPGTVDSAPALVLLLVTGVGLAALLLGAAFPSARARPALFLASAGLPGLSALAVMAWGGLLRPAASGTALPLATAGATAFPVFLSVLLAWALLFAFRLPAEPRPGEAPGRPARRSRGAGLAVLLAVLTGGGWVLFDDVSRLRADAYFQTGERLFQRKQWADSAVPLGAAARACPRGAVYWLRLGDALREKTLPALAEKSPGPVRVAGTGDLRDLPERIFPEELRESGLAADLVLAQDALAKAGQEDPYHFLPPLLLGKLYSPWALTENDGPRRRELAARAGLCFDAGTRLYPAGTQAWTEWGKLLFWVEGRTEEAGRMAERALSLRADYPAAWSLKAEILLSRNEFSRAAAALGKLPPDFPGALETWDALASAAYQARDLDCALAATRRCLELDPEGAQAWTYHRNLAALYVEKGDWAQAAREARLALSNAPAPERPALEALLAAGRK